MQRLLFLTFVIAAAECASFRIRRDLVQQFKQIEDLPPFDNDDHHIWNHPWQKTFNAEHSSHGDIAIFGRFRSEADPSLGADGILTPVVPDVSHSNKQLGPENTAADNLGSLADRVVMPSMPVNQR